MKLNAFLLIVIVLLTYKIAQMRTDMENIELMVSKTIPKIASKSYFTGCVDAQETDCLAKSLKFKEDFERFLNGPNSTN